MSWRISDRANSRFRRSGFLRGRATAPLFGGIGGVGFSVSIGSGDVTTGTLLTATVNGLVGGEVVTYQWTDDGANIAGATSQTYTPAIGTDSVADASLIRCVVTVDGTPYTSNARRIVYAVGSFAALTPQTYTDDTGNQTYTHAAATGTGLTWTYAATGLISGVTYNPATRTFTFDTNALAVQSGTNAGSVSATDQYGRAATGSPRSLTLTIQEVAQLTAVDLQAQESNGDVPVSLTGDAGTYSWILTTTDPAVSPPTRTQVVAGQTHTGSAAPASGTVAAVDATPVDIALPSGLSGSYYLVVADGDSILFDGTAQAIDTTAPTLSGVSTTPGDTTAALDWSTNTGSGAAYWVLTTSATVPSVAQIVAGQDHTGAAATGSGSPTISASGAQTQISVTSLTNATTYHFHIFHRDAFANDSAISSASVTPAAGSGIVISQLGTTQLDTAAASATRTFTIDTSGHSGTDPVLILFGGYNPSGGTNNGPVSATVNGSGVGVSVPTDAIQLAADSFRPAAAIFLVQPSGPLGATSTIVVTSSGTCSAGVCALVKAPGATTFTAAKGRDARSASGDATATLNQNTALGNAVVGVGMTRDGVPASTGITGRETIDAGSGEQCLIGWDNDVAAATPRSMSISAPFVGGTVAVAAVSMVVS